MIRVLHIVGTMDVGGIERFIMNTYRNIEREQVQFDFVVHKKERNYYEDEIESLGGTVHRVERKSKNIIKNIIQMYRLFKNNPQYKIIHIHTNSATCITDLLIAALCNVPQRIVHSHSTKTKKSKKYIHKTFRSIMNVLANRKLACSDLAAQWLFGENQYIKNKVQIVNNAIDLDLFKFNKDTSVKYRNELNIRQDSFVVGHIGSLSNAKNHSFLIDIFKAILEKESNSTLVIVGEGPHKKEITDKINELNLTDDVILTGLRNDIPELLSLFDVLIFPSFYEGFPVTLVEAQASGLPCIISDTITKQVKTTELVQFISLNKKPGDWADQALFTKSSNNRIDTYSQIVSSGFDINTEASKLQRFYQELQGG